MKAIRVLASLALVAVTASAANAQFVRCSWNSCDPQHINQNFAGPGVYNLVISLTGANLENIGHDVTLVLYPDVPDAWRFDDLGCQTGSQLSISTNAFLKTCPAMRGSNPFPITFYGYDGGVQQATLRMLNTYDTFSPDPSARYTLWAVAFDHSFSEIGPGSPPASCGGAERPLSLEVRRAEYLRQDGGKDLAQTAMGDGNPCTWNQSVVPTRATTLGRVKAQYR